MAHDLASFAAHLMAVAVESEVLKHELLDEACKLVENEAKRVIDDLIAANPGQAAQVKEKPQAIGWFVGQVMKETGGKANPAAVNEILKAKLGL